MQPTTSTIQETPLPEISLADCFFTARNSDLPCPSLLPLLCHIQVKVQQKLFYSTASTTSIGPDHTRPVQLFGLSWERDGPQYKLKADISAASFLHLAINLI
jgi:hypothetical protein